MKTFLEIAKEQNSSESFMEKTKHLHNFKYFGTDMGEFKGWGEDMYLTSGYLYGIEEHQYNSDEGDVTSYRAFSLIK